MNTRIIVLLVIAFLSALFGYTEIVSGGSGSAKILFYSAVTLLLVTAMARRYANKGKVAQKQKRGPFALLNVPTIILAFSCPIYLLLIWGRLPERITSHFDSFSRPDKFMSKVELWIPCLFLSLVGLAASRFLLSGRAGRGRWDSVESYAPVLRPDWIALFVLTALNFIVVISLTDNIRMMDRLMIPIVSLLLAYIGYHANTSQTTINIWLYGGILVCILSFFCPVEVLRSLIFVLFIVIIAPVLITIMLGRPLKAFP